MICTCMFYFISFQNVTYEFVGTSNYTQCMETVNKLFNFGANCSYSECSFNGSYQAPVMGEFYVSL